MTKRTTVSAIILALLGCAATIGCGSEASTDEGTTNGNNGNDQPGNGDSTPSNTGPGGNGDTTPSCEDDHDCGGGMVCQDHLCKPDCDGGAPSNDGGATGDSGGSSGGGSDGGGGNTDGGGTGSGGDTDGGSTYDGGGTGQDAGGSGGGGLTDAGGGSSDDSGGGTGGGSDAGSGGNTGDGGAGDSGSSGGNSDGGSGGGSDGGSGCHRDGDCSEGQVCNDGTCAPHCGGHDHGGQTPSCPASKALVCHVPPGNPGNAHTICVGKPAVPAHLAHGDYAGSCTQ